MDKELIDIGKLESPQYKYKSRKYWQVDEPYKSGKTQNGAAGSTTNDPRIDS